MEPTKIDMYRIIREATGMTLSDIKDILSVPEHPKTLRDEVAIATLSAMIGNENKEPHNRGKQGVPVFTKYAYEWADAMLEARLKTLGVDNENY